MALLRFFQKRLTWSIPGFMLLGVLFGAIFDVKILQNAILPLTFLMVYPMMVNLRIQQVFSRGDSYLQVVTQLLNFALIPLLGYEVAIVFFSDNPYLMLGILLTSLLPTSGMTISWTGFAKGNVPAAVKMTVIGLMLGSLLTPVYLQLLLGKTIAIPAVDVFKQIAIVVFLPMAAGYATQWLLRKRYGTEIFQKTIAPKFPLVATLGVLGIVFVAMALKAKAIIAAPHLLLLYSIPIIILYAINFFVSTVIGRVLFRRENAVALVYGSVMRNLSIALAIAMAVFGEKGSDVALIIALAYIIQVQAAAWYNHFSDRIFGRIES